MFKTEKDFQEALTRLNALNNEWYCWNPTTARKDHVDAFGAPIKWGETYYKMELGGSVTNHEKLSRSSMETFLRLVVSGSPKLQKLAAKQLQARDDSSREAIQSLEPPPT